MSINKPSELDILKVSPQEARFLGKVTTGQIFGSGSNFHPEGLFSVEIFGAVGSEVRMEQFGVIDLNMSVITPVVYKNITELGSLYSKIMKGQQYAEFDEKLKDFVPSMSENADTGYAFFLKHLPELKFKENESRKRKYKIELVYKAIKEDTILMNYLFVLPAGMRDYIVGKDGRPEEDEINTFYKRIINIVNLIDKDRARTNPELFNDSAHGLQTAIANLYEYILTILDGKNKLIQGKWVSRRVFNSSSNVASSYVDTTEGLSDPRQFKYDDTRIGLHQYCRSFAPVTLYNIRNKYIRDIFPDNSNIVYLTNSKTLKREEVVVRSIQKDIDLWTSMAGLEKVTASLGNFDILDKPIVFTPKGKRTEMYMGLLYKDNEKFKFFQDIDDLPEHLDKKNVRPVSFFEFIYMSIYNMNKKYPALVTRYPIGGIGSSYPTWTVLTTTVETESLYEMDHEWMVDKEDPDKLAVNFPIFDSGYFRTITVHVCHLGRLGGDFDGDTLHIKGVVTDEAIEDVKKYMSKKENYINDAGEYYYSNSNDILDAVFKYMS